MTRLTRIAEIRRTLPVLAAGLLLLALAFPMWRITLEAPQYPDGLFVEMYVYPRLEGDVAETQGLNQYVGFYYPDPVFMEPNYDVNPNAIEVPEWTFGPLAFIALAGAGVFVALAPTVRKLKLGLTGQLVGTATAFVVMFGLIQYRLYQAGHSLDPNAPMRGVDSFTPPMLGYYEIANISGIAWFGPGGYLTMVAFLLLVVAFLSRDSSATVGDIPTLLGDAFRGLRNRFSSGRDDDGRLDDRHQDSASESREQIDDPTAREGIESS